MRNEKSCLLNSCLLESSIKSPLSSNKPSSGLRLRCYQAGNLEAIYIRVIPWVIEPVFVVSLDGSRTRWTCNRCFWQCAAWDLCNNIHLASGIFT
ncbi:BnaC04g31450D [Brassica napus]|uniref:BnaC04g31450D protein n=1 Tax=Brassica napus TaxID=3708 RepID=A0A078HJK4_BRANA|nr:BnaC04g31450D [Brassica napus]